MKNNKNEQQKVKKAVELLNAEMKTKYPKGSFIVFSTTQNKDEEPATTSCSWYNKVGGEVTQDKIVDRPAEWQNIPYEEAKRISEMFDKCMFCDLRYV